MTTSLEVNLIKLIEGDNNLSLLHDYGGHGTFKAEVAGLEPATHGLTIHCSAY